MAGFGAHHIGLFFIFAAFGLMLVASVSLPIWTKVYWAESATYRIGSWGYCQSGQCTDKVFGYRLVVGTTKIVTHWLTYASAIANPVAAFFCLLALFFAGCNNLCAGIIGSILALLAFFFTIVALAFDLGLAIESKRRINASGTGENASIGLGIWLVVAAAGSALISSMLICCTHSSRARKHRKNRDSATVDNAYATDPY